MVYRLENGFRIRTARVGNAVEFETKNANGETISTVHRTHAEAVPLLKRLALSDSLRFMRQYGGVHR
ncbi:hypothetical protein AB0O76_04760 [Streptomyces sp. NPDC086554]|uniref:hypothetical protein n=1 Tax=Streptomyces sp. NPDC086554 TaxID=3154864 RepID=UPI00341D44C8